MVKGRAPKDFTLDYGANVGAEFELWLEDLNAYLAIGEVTDADEKKRLSSIRLDWVFVAL